MPEPSSPLSSSGLVSFILDHGQLYLADKVRYLLEPEVRGTTVPAGNHLLARHVLEGGVERVGGHALPGVIVDLYDVVGLQGLQLVEEQEDQVPLRLGAESSLMRNLPRQRKCRVLNPPGI